LCWQKVKDGVGDNQNIEGKDGITYHEFDRYPRTSQHIDGDHDKFCREALMKMPSNSDDIKQKK
jgi:hypothetical protein